MRPEKSTNEHSELNGQDTKQKYSRTNTRSKKTKKKDRRTEQQTTNIGQDSIKVRL
jgi:hypothetical protein